MERNTKRLICRTQRRHSLTPSWLGGCSICTPSAHASSGPRYAFRSWHLSSSISSSTMLTVQSTGTRAHWVKMGFAASKFDPSLFTWKGPKGSVCILLYVDDLVVTGPDLAKLDLTLLNFRAFEMNLANLHYFLSIEVNMSLLSQRHYVLNMLFKFNMTHSYPTSCNTFQRCCGYNILTCRT